MPLHERFLAIDDLMQRGNVLNSKLMQAQVFFGQVSLPDARAWQGAYTTWVAACLPRLDADLQRLFTAAHLGGDDRLGAQRVLELLVQARDPDPAMAEPAAAMIRPQFWGGPLNNLLDHHLEILGTARRRAFPASTVVSADLKERIAASQKHRLSPSIDELFVASGCESHWWVQPFEPYTLASAQCVYGWLTAIQVYAPDREIAIVRAVIQAVLRTARLRPAQRDALQRHLEVFHVAPPPQPVPIVSVAPPAHAPTMLSCFISYSSQDEALAEQLYADLHAEGVRCWLAPHDLTPGEVIVRGIDEAIRLHDKVVLLLSEAAVASHWVAYEVNLATTREAREGRTVLYPLRLDDDDAVLTTTQGWAATLRMGRHIGDFRQWKEYAAYQQGVGRLLRDLRRAALEWDADATGF